MTDLHLAILTAGGLVIALLLGIILHLILNGYDPQDDDETQ